MPVSTTSQPACASSTAMGRPMERMRPAPVTTATLPSRPVNISPLIPGVWRTLAAFVGSILEATWWERNSAACTGSGLTP